MKNESARVHAADPLESTYRLDEERPSGSERCVVRLFQPRLLPHQETKKSRRPQRLKASTNEMRFVGPIGSQGASFFL